MIRNEASSEFHVPGGIVCIHAHIYTDSVRDSQILEAEVREYFKQIEMKLVAEGRSRRKPLGALAGPQRV